MAGCWKVSNFILSFCITLWLVALVKSDRITDQIYKKIDASFSCFRRLNGTHQIGCSSPQSGSVGVVHYAANISSLQWLVESGPHAPYVVVIKPDLFRRDNLMKLKESDKIAGVVVLNYTNTSPVMSVIPSPPYSNDLSCPNRLSSLYQEEYSSYCDENPWNYGGDGLLFEDLPFSIFFLNESTSNHSALLDDCYFKFNEPNNGKPPNYPLCAIEMKAFMWAAVDTPTCLRRGRLNMLLNPQPSEYCDPLGSVNIFVPALAFNKSVRAYRNRSVVVISARIDSASIFDGLSIGADSAITGMTTLIAVADLINKFTSVIEAKAIIDNVYLILFNGEAFDYIGSSRMVYDMTKGVFPRPLNESNPSQSPLFSLEHIKYWIELGSLAPHSESTVFLHTDPLSRNEGGISEKITELINAFKSNSGNLKVDIVDKSIPLPPASVQSFLKKDLEIPAIFIANHRNSFANKYYNSEWDTFSAISSSKLSKQLASIARAVAGTVYELASGESMPSSLTANSTLIDSTLECYLINSNCSLFNWLLSGRNNLATGSVLPTYVGVSHGNDAYKPLIVRTRHLLAYVSGQPLDVNKTGCIGGENDELYHYYWLGGFESDNSSGTCYRTTVKTSSAVSPAFIIDDYNWTSMEYSTWTESRWESFSVRLFLKASPIQEISVFVVGVIVLLLSFIITYWLEIKSDHLFASPEEAVAC